MMSINNWVQILKEKLFKERKMMSIDNWMQILKEKLLKAFDSRIKFIGLQGSYSRNEADENSDIDAVVILDRLTVQDMEIYKTILSKMPYSEKSCGFISGAAEIKCWDRSDLFQFVNDTKPLYGSLDFLPEISKDDIKKSVLTGACSIYHMCCHNYIHEKDNSILISLYKYAFFTIQAELYYINEIYISDKNKIIEYLTEQEKEIIETGQKLKYLYRSKIAFTDYYEKLINWSSAVIQNFGR